TGIGAGSWRASRSAGAAGGAVASACGGRPFGRAWVGAAAGGSNRDSVYNGASPGVGVGSGVRGGGPDSKVSAGRSPFEPARRRRAGGAAASNGIVAVGSSPAPSPLVVMRRVTARRVVARAPARRCGASLIVPRFSLLACLESKGQKAVLGCFLPPIGSLSCSRLAANRRPARSPH